MRWSTRELIGATQDRGAKFSVVNKKSPYVIIDGGRDDFEMIAVSGKKGQEYHFELRSLCNCLGFRKLILSPVSFLLSDSGEIVEAGLPSFVGDLGPIITRFDGTFPADGKYFLLVASNNAERGTTLATSKAGKGIAFELFPIHLKAYPSGDLELVWNKKKMTDRSN